MNTAYQERYSLEFLPVTVPEKSHFASYRLVPARDFRYLVPCLVLETLVFYDHPPLYAQRFLAKLQQHSQNQEFVSQLELLLLAGDTEAMTQAFFMTSFVQAFKAVCKSIHRSQAGRPGHWVYEVLSQYLDFNVYVYQESQLGQFVIFDYQPGAPTLYMLECEEAFFALLPRQVYYQKTWQFAKIADEMFLSGMMDDVSPEFLRSLSETAPEELRRVLTEQQEVVPLNLAQLLQIFEYIPEATVRKTYEELGYDSDSTYEILMTVPRPMPGLQAPPLPQSFLKDLGTSSQIEPGVFEDVLKHYKATREASQRLYKLAINAQTGRNYRRANELRSQAGESMRIGKMYFDIIHLEMFRRNNQQLLKTNRVDLHWLRVPEALQVIKEFIEHCKEKQINQLTVITGKGNNSYAGIPLIKLAVQQWRTENNICLQPAASHLTITL